MSDTRKIIMADHHPLAAAALSAAARGLDAKLEVQSVEDMSALVLALESGEYAMIVVNLGRRDGDGLRGLAKLHNQYPEIPILVIHGEASEDHVEQARLRGAQGFLGAPATLAEASSALAGLLGGGQWFPRFPARHRKPMAFERLSPAQKRVLAELSQGKPNREIAEGLCLSEATIKSHLYAIYKELGVKNRTQALLKVQGL